MCSSCNGLFGVFQLMGQLGYMMLVLAGSLVGVLISRFFKKD